MRKMAKAEVNKCWGTKSADLRGSARLAPSSPERQGRKRHATERMLRVTPLAKEKPRVVAPVWDLSC